MSKLKVLHILLTGAMFGLTALPGLAQTDKTGTTRTNDPRSLPADHFIIKSTLRVDLENNTATLPLHRGTCNGQTVWYVLTDVSDEMTAQKLGINFAPRLRNLMMAPGQTQTVMSDSLPLGSAPVTFEGAPDFSPTRRLLRGPMGFPVMGAAPGGMADIHYSPFVHAGTEAIVYNAPIVATGDGPFDVKMHTNTQERVMAIDAQKMTVDLLVVRGFTAGQPILYLSFEDSDVASSVIERATFAGALAASPAANRSEDVAKSARAAIFAFANGQAGTTSPPAQGLNHVILDGHNAEEASLDNIGLMKALREGGDARNVQENAPTFRDPKLRGEYSPLWDVHLAEWTPEAIARGLNVAQTDANRIRQLAKKGLITSPSGAPLGSANIVVNCPVVAFTDQPPTAPVAPKPKDVP